MLTSVRNVGIGSGGSCRCFCDDYLDSVEKGGSRSSGKDPESTSLRDGQTSVKKTLLRYCQVVVGYFSIRVLRMDLNCICPCGDCGWCNVLVGWRSNNLLRIWKTY